MIVWIWLAQSFTPQMPASVPPVTGTIVERAVLRSIDVAVGTGAEAKPGQEYTVHYTGWLRDGQQFDSSRTRKEPFVFVQGRRQVIAGWEAGFEGMRVGGQRRLFLPYQMAYGEAGRGAIPPKAELIFDVELLNVRDVEPEVATVDVLHALDEYEKKLMRLVEAMPEEKYGFRPAPNTRTFGEVLAHVALGNRLMADLAEKVPAPADLRARVEAQWKSEAEPRTKTQLTQLLQESFADVRKRLEPMRPGSLAREVTFFGQKNTVRGVYVLLDAHVAEHLGQLIAYARMAGVRPPWSAQ